MQESAYPQGKKIANWEFWKISHVIYAVQIFVNQAFVNINVFCTSNVVYYEQKFVMDRLCQENLLYLQICTNIIEA